MILPPEIISSLEQKHILNSFPSMIQETQVSFPQKLRNLIRIEILQPATI